MEHISITGPHTDWGHGQSVNGLTDHDEEEQRQELENRF